MRKRRFLPVLLSAAMVMSMTACSEDDYDEETSEGKPSVTVEATTANNAKDPNTASSSETNSEIKPSGSMRTVSMSVDKTTGAMTIERMNTVNAVKAETGTWTVFVYMCGADLESESGMGTADLQEMMEASTGDNVRFVIFTGGASEWENSTVDADKLQTYVIQNGEMELVSEKKSDNMGKPSVLAESLKAAIEKYPAEKMGLILWNHGSGSINGVCFDEKYDDDSLSLQELDEALLKVTSATSSRFEFIGFDACLMGTLETANIVATYANYMYGSEETEPGYGWNYTAIGNFLGKNNTADGLALGKKVTDSFIDMCKEIDEEDIATFAVYDLSKLDEFITAYNNYFYGVYSKISEDSSLATKVAKGFSSADNFGGNNKSEGYTNMVDLGNALQNIESVGGSAKTVLSALDSLVAYNINGNQHKTSLGLATYYPLSVQGSEEMNIFSKVCVSPYYLSILDMLQQYNNNSVDFSNYSNDGIFSDDDGWSNIYNYIFGDDDEYEVDYDTDEDYFDYVEPVSSDGDSEYITFEQEPVLDEDGEFYFILDEDGYDYTADIYASVYMAIDDDYIEMGETYDIYSYDEYTYADYFDGYWISLPDGQNLALYPLGYDDEWLYYTSPILLNDEEVYMHISQNIEEGEIYINGIWGGLDDNGSASRVIYEMEEGDIIVPIFYIAGEDDYYVGNEYEYDPDDQLNYEIMDPGIYYYTFVIDDIFGGYYESAYVEFEVDEDGEVYFYE